MVAEVIVYALGVYNICNGKLGFGILHITFASIGFVVCVYTLKFRARHQKNLAELDELNAKLKILSESLDVALDENKEALDELKRIIDAE